MIRKKAEPLPSSELAASGIHRLTSLSVPANPGKQREADQSLFSLCINTKLELLFFSFFDFSGSTKHFLLHSVLF